MGMDVYGRENGVAYFRASVWQWRPLHLLICEANKRFSLGIPKKTIRGMEFNQGDGLESQAQCDRLAQALEVILQEHGEVITLDMEPQGTEGELLKVLEPLKAEGWQLLGDDCYRISKEQAKEFISFLRVCGGFAVW